MSGFDIVNILAVKPQPLTEESFAPYGRVIGGGERREPDFNNEGGTKGWRHDLQIEKPLYMTLETPPGTRIVSQLECHLNVTQTFLPLGGGPAALVVAKPTHHGLPEPDDVAAFLLDGSVGYALHVGTWHSLDRLPTSETATMWLMITDSDTQADLVNVRTETAVHTRTMQLTEKWGFPIEIDV